MILLSPQREFSLPAEFSLPPAALLPPAFPVAASAGSAIADAAAAEPGFVVGLVLDDAAIAITFPALRTSVPGDHGRLLERAQSLLPPSLDLFSVHSASIDLGECFGRLRAERMPAGFLIIDTRTAGDAALVPLARALLAALPEDRARAAASADAIGAVIAARLAEDGRVGGATRRRSCGLLPKWRLKRVTDYIDAHLDEPITLADLGAAAKLTRMHFAAQFKAATGLRPHEYLLRRRIERAKTMLVDDDLPIVEVALAVGFQTQAHFTTVFGRFVGETPYQWRRARAAERRAAAALRPSARPCGRRPDPAAPLGLA